MKTFIESYQSGSSVFLAMDEETGEINYSLHVSKDAETGEEEYVNYWLDQETGEKQYFSLDRICHSLQMPNPFRINRYATHLTAIVQNSKHKTSQKRMEFITAIVFLLPTFIIFTPLLGIIVLIFDVILHKWCHRKNARLAREDMIYYRSPLHMIYREFCLKCIAEEHSRKIEEIHNRRLNRKRSAMEMLKDTSGLEARL
ncbi:hypothetical protein YQE_03646, partial [Dendroctonus ponderosae]